MSTIRAIVREGRIEPLEKFEIPEGSEVLVTPVFDEPAFWLMASESALDPIWDNSEDDVYAELLKE
jgi:hypothetical protein